MPFSRVFISSTYYDLRFVRADLAILEEQMALEIVRFETGSIPYHTADTLSEACCKEIDNCHILLSIIGGRYGSVVETSAIPPSSVNHETSELAEKGHKRIISVSRLEVERAIRSGLLLFTFVDADVLAEHKTYTSNKENAPSIKWTAVDTIAVFEFIDFIYSLPGKNPVFPFRTPKEIQDTFRDQLSGIFCDLLSREKLEKYASHLDQVIKSAEKLEELQARLKHREREVEMQMKEMLLPDHQFYHDIKQAVNSQFRIFFKSKAELVEIMRHFDYEEVSSKEIQKEKSAKTIYFHAKNNSAGNGFIGIPRDMFNESGELKLPNQDLQSGTMIWVGKNI